MGFFGKEILKKHLRSFPVSIFDRLDQTRIVFDSQISAENEESDLVSIIFYLRGFLSLCWRGGHFQQRKRVGFLRQV